MRSEQESVYGGIASFLSYNFGYAIYLALGAVKERVLNKELLVIMHKNGFIAEMLS